MTFRLQYAAISDVGRVRKDNQDSGYAGPWLLTVCDGVGGAARGDLASSTAIGQLRRLDEPPPDDENDARHRLDLVAGALHRASDKIGDLVDDEPSLSGTSTTATVALFDGARLAMGHIGDSRAYLYRSNELSQLTTDHTFVQSLIDEGRISEADARTHHHRNLGRQQTRRRRNLGRQQTRRRRNLGRRRTPRHHGRTRNHRTPALAARRRQSFLYRKDGTWPD